MTTKKDTETENPQSEELEAAEDVERKPTLRPAVGPRVGIAQIEPALGDLEANLERHAEAVQKAKLEGIDILVFPELSLTGYRLKDTVPDVALARSDTLVGQVTALSTDVSLVVGLVLEAKDHSFFNGAAYMEGGEILHVHRKVYLPTYGMFDEQRYFARGNRVAAFDTKHGRIAMLICEDMLHPSALTIAALDGASTVLVPSASPVRGVMGAGEEEEDLAKSNSVDANGRHWEAYNRTMARSLGIYVVHANRVGVEDGQTFWGGSEIVGPDGSTLAKAAYYEPDMISAVIVDSAIRRQRIQSPLLRDEDVDFTINELCRVRGRLRPAFPREDQGGHGRDDRRGHDRRPREGGGFDRRGDRPDNRGGYERRSDRSDNRGPERRREGSDNRGYDRRSDRSDDRGYGRRSDRPDDRGSERRSDRPDNRGYDRRSDRSDDRPRPARDGDRPMERRSKPPGGFFGADRGRSDDRGYKRAQEDHDQPRRQRPGRGERTPRPVGGKRGRDKGDS